MALKNFIAELWAAGIERNLHRTQVFAQPGVCNRNYEGEIKAKGDTVRITSIGAITVFDYVKDTDMAPPQALTDAQLALTITQQKAYNFAVDDVDKTQGNPAVMDEATYEAAYALANLQDNFVAGLYTDVSANNMLGSDASPKTFSVATDIYPYLVDLKVKLDESDVPPEGRWAAVPPWFEGYMLKDDRFIKSFLQPVAGQALLNGQVARAAGFDIMISNNVTYSGSQATGNYRIMAGHPSAITFAEQLMETEAYRPEKRFADAVKGLNLYGAKVVKPRALSLLTITRQ